MPPLDPPLLMEFVIRLHHILKENSSHVKVELIVNEPFISLMRWCTLSDWKRCSWDVWRGVLMVASDGCISGGRAISLEPAILRTHSERHGGIATAPPLCRSYSDRAVTSPGGAFQTNTNLANHRHHPKLLADCQWHWRWQHGLGRLRNTQSLTKTIPRDGWKLIKLMLRKWTFLPPCSHLIHQFVKRHLVTIRREQHVLAQWLRQ